MACYSCSGTGQTSDLFQLFQKWPNQCPVTVVPELAKPWPVTVVPEVAKPVTCYSCSRTGQTSALLQLFQNWPNQCPVTVVPEVAKPVACLISSDSEPGPDHPIRTEEGKMSPSVLQMAHHLRSSLSGLLISLTSRLHSHRPNIDRTGRSFTRKTLPPPHPTPVSYTHLTLPTKIGV